MVPTIGPQSNQSTGQPSWLSLNQTSKLDSHPGCHSIKTVNWTAILAITQSTATTAAPATAAVSQELWNLGGALVQRAQEPNIPCGESLTSMRNSQQYPLLAPWPQNMISLQSLQLKVESAMS